MKTEDLIKYALIAVGAYLVWEYVIAPMMAAAPASGTTTTGTGTGTNTTKTTTGTGTGTANLLSSSTQSAPPPAQSPSNQLSTSILAACGGIGQPSCASADYALTLNAIAGGSDTNLIALNIDQWAYYFNGSPLNGGATLTGNQFVAMMNAGGITSTNRSTLTMNASQFIYLLGAAGVTPTGMSGIINLPTAANMGMGNLRGGFNRRPNAFSGSGGGAGRRQTIH